MKKIFTLLTVSSALFMAVTAQAGGIALSGTRIIYPQDSRQIEVSAKNTSDKSSFLVQSWVDDAQGNKVSSFFVTPPLYVSKPGNENKMRLIYNGSALPKDRESLFYFNSKAIPSVNKQETENKNVLVIAATTRIKLFVRPQGLSPAADKAPESLKVTRAGKSITLSNPTPYFITIGEMKVGGALVKEALMVPPKGSITTNVANAAGAISIRTINDYGAYSNPLSF